MEKTPILKYDFEISYRGIIEKNGNSYIIHIDFQELSKSRCLKAMAEAKVLSNSV